MHARRHRVAEGHDVSLHALLEVEPAAHHAGQQRRIPLESETDVAAAVGDAHRNPYQHLVGRLDAQIGRTAGSQVAREVRDAHVATDVAGPRNPCRGPSPGSPGQRGRAPWDRSRKPPPAGSGWSGGARSAAAGPRAARRRHRDPTPEAPATASRAARPRTSATSLAGSHRVAVGARGVPVRRPPGGHPAVLHLPLPGRIAAARRLPGGRVGQQLEAHRQPPLEHRRRRDPCRGGHRLSGDRQSALDLRHGDPLVEADRDVERLRIAFHSSAFWPPK